MARPTDYREEYNEQVIGLCRLGATDVDLANFFNVAEKTIDNWKNKYPEFLQSIKEGKEVSDLNVAQSLYNKACGGDTTAMIFWLKNRRKKEWRDKHETELTGAGGGPIMARIERVIVDNPTNKNS